MSYMKSVHLQKDKSIFDLTQLPVEAFAASLGLPGAPQIKFIGQAHQRKNAARGKLQQQQEEEEKNKAREGIKTNVAGEKEVETKLAGVELGDSESDASEVGSDGEEDESESEVEVDGAVESDDDDESVAEAKDDVPASNKVSFPWRSILSSLPS